MAELTQSEVEQWIINSVTGKFHYTKILDGQIDPKLYAAVRTILHRAKDKGIVAPVDGKDGWWRPVDRNMQEICWWEASGEIGENIILPLGMNKYCYIPLPSLIVIAGKYNTGKTALCINIVNANMDKWKNKLDFYVSEGMEMMGTKFKNLNTYIPKPPPFKMYRRTENFADIIHPDHLSVIDYLRVDMEKSYAVSTPLFEIFDKLGKDGAAVVAMQKPPGDRKLAFGGAGTAFEPSLYIAMDKDVIRFEKIKIPKIMDYDPYMVKIQFKLKNGVNFYDVNELVE
ncbi:MAG: hypothetical protein MUP81_02920 [Dehalococcoidia bacterium]|nr:hypothetical protein [Dehalococcoidia bacterium]